MCIFPLPWSKITIMVRFLQTIVLSPVAQYQIFPENKWMTAYVHLRHADCELALFFISCGCKYTNPVNHHMGNCFLDLTVANGAKNELQPTCLIITSREWRYRFVSARLIPRCLQLMDKKMSCQRMSFAYIYE